MHRMQQVRQILFRSVIGGQVTLFLMSICFRKVATEHPPSTKALPSGQNTANRYRLVLYGSPRYYGRVPVRWWSCFFVIAGTLRELMALFHSTLGTASHGPVPIRCVLARRERFCRQRLLGQVLCESKLTTRKMFLGPISQSWIIHVWLAACDA